MTRRSARPLGPLFPPGALRHAAHGRLSPAMEAAPAPQVQRDTEGLHTRKPQGRAPRVKPPGPLALVLLFRPPFTFFLEGGGGDVKGLNFWGVSFQRQRQSTRWRGPRHPLSSQKLFQVPTGVPKEQPVRAPIDS